jgi:hypothetical protein
MIQIFLRWRRISHHVASRSPFRGGRNRSAISKLVDLYVDSRGWCEAGAALPVIMELLTTTTPTRTTPADVTSLIDAVPTHLPAELDLPNLTAWTPSSSGIWCMPLVRF